MSWNKLDIPRPVCIKEQEKTISSAEDSLPKVDVLDLSDLWMWLNRLFQFQFLLYALLLTHASLVDLRKIKTKMRNYYILEIRIIEVYNSVLNACTSFLRHLKFNLSYIKVTISETSWWIGCRRTSNLSKIILFYKKNGFQYHFQKKITYSTDERAFLFLSFIFCDTGLQPKNDAYS